MTNIPRSSTTRQRSSIISTWVSAIRLFQQGQLLLSQAIHQANANKSPQESITKLEHLEDAIEQSLLKLAKDIEDTATSDVSEADLLTLIHHTETILQWCVDVKKTLEIDSRKE